MEQQAGRQMLQGQQGRVTSVSIKLSPVAPSATGSSAGSCSMCSQLCLLPSVPGCKPRFFSLCTHPWEHGGHRGFTSRVGQIPQRCLLSSWKSIQLLCVVQEGSWSQELSNMCSDIGKM